MRSIFGLSPTKDEPYLTQVFSFLLESDRQFCHFLINDVFGLQLVGVVKEIIPEASVDSGRPDIVLVFENSVRIAVENKIGAGFTPNQLERYKSEFDYVILLYQYLSESEQVNFATKSLTWYSVYSITKKYVQNLSDDYDLINKFLLDQFIRYLEETNMAIEKVSWEILNGTKSLLNLFAQIKGAFEKLKGNSQIKNYGSPSSSSWYMGWKVTLGEDNDFSVYVLYHPLLIISGFQDLDDKWASTFKRIREIHPQWYWVDWWHLETLDISKNNFLCLSVDEQVITIIEFLERSIQKYFQ